ncbi:UPF0547 protein C16orf87 homolog [Dendronephthya gigantea]|uniref:UPF0547 protein C16orf87 homolog n=1 Tax=Dendronephthya gigantea TaxID=151771 RepID=UPI00106BA0B0|nr:UPF0547 protein C16orf87 homolog [Dendronephthya gigantea]
MAKKKCPKCQQTLPVACKSCPCGHIFIAKKSSTSKDTVVKKPHTSVTRLRPERPKREIPDYEYRDDYTRISVGNGNAQLKTISKKMKLMDEDVYGDDDDDILINGTVGFERLDSVESQPGPVKRKRGRPKGSKNKPKDDQNFTADLSDDNEDPLDSQGSGKLGKSKLAKNKVYQLPPIPEDKVVVYSLILSDINERFVSQNKIKCLPGL